jgi:hypothetical protein
LEAAKSDGNNLEYASNELKNNFDIVMEAVKNDGSNLFYASENHQINSKTILRLPSKEMEVT